MLVLDFDNGKLFYNNQTRGLPFKNAVPQPKNIVLNVSSINTVQEPNTGKL